MNKPFNADLNDALIHQLPVKHAPVEEPISERAAALKKQIINFADVEPNLELNYLVNGWLQQGSLSMIYGPSNVGKTFVALDLAAHVAAGVNWRDRRVRSGSVLYISAEGAGGIQNRLAAIARERPELAGGDLSILPAALDLHSGSDVEALSEALRGKRFALIVIDTLARSMGQGDENSTKDATQLINNCQMLKDLTGAHIMLVHHSGKDGDKGARGSYVFKASVDTEIFITENQEIKCPKQRDMPIPATLSFELTSVTLGCDADGDAVTSAVVLKTDKPKPQQKALSGKAEVAMNAFDEALLDFGQIRSAENYPKGKKVLEISQWKDALRAHGLLNGKGDSTDRMAFKRVKDQLIELNRIREFEGYVWKVFDDE